MADSLLSPSLITKETLVILVNNLVFASRVNRQFENQFVKIGATLTVRKPNRFVRTLGPGLQLQNIVEPSTSITVSTQSQASFQFSSQDLTLVIEEFKNRYLKPAAETIANGIDYDCASQVPNVANLVGSAGTDPNAYSYLQNLGARMDNLAVPQDGRTLILNPDGYWALDAALIGLYVKSVAEPALKGYLAKIANFDIYADQNIQRITNGAYAGTGVVNGANQAGSSIITNGWTASVTNLFLGGEVIHFASVYGVNPQSRQKFNGLAQFTVTGPVSSDSAGNAVIPISPAIVTSGAYQNVTGSPANLALITVDSGSKSTDYANNIGFVRDAFGLITVPMDIPGGVDFAAREMVRGISMRIIRAYDINSDVMPCRIDVLSGNATFYQELATRLIGA